MWGRSKFGSRKTQVDGIIFDSKKEAEYYSQLKLFMLAGEITDIQLQVPFELQPNFRYNGKLERAIKYIADFVVTYNDGHQEVIDVKGMRTKEYALKRKLLLFRYPNLIFKEV